MSSHLMPTLSRLFVHPVKSLAGFGTREAEARKRGLRHDRSWVVVAPGGRALTQREWPGMALVAATVGDDALVLSTPGRDALRVVPDSTRRVLAIVWGDEVDAADGGDPAARWLSEFLGTECRLAYMDERARRVTHPDGGPGRAVRFADELPLLLLSESSLADLEARVPADRRPVVAERFRPNLVVDGCEPFAEDRWRRLRIGDVEIEVVKPAGRCALVTVDPATGEKDPRGEPLRTLATYRRSTRRDYAHEPSHVYLGVRAAVTRTGTLRTGDRVEVLD